MSEFKLQFRSHNFGELCASLSKPSLTETQEKTLKNLIDKGENATLKQKETRAELIKKRDAPMQLGAVGKSLVKRIFNEEIRQTYKQNLESMYTSKGNEMESFAIQRIARVNGWGICVKNEQTFKDNIGFGTPDVVKKNFGFDSKCSFTDETFPLWENELKESNYIWQNYRYCMLTGRTKWYTCYSLENSPEEAVIKHAWQLLKKSGQTEMTDSFIDDVRGLHNFDHLPDWARVKTFEVNLTDEHVKIAQTAYKLGLEYFNELIENYKTFEK